MTKKLGDIVKKQYGFEVDETPEPMNEATKLYWDEVFSKKETPVERWDVQKIYNAINYFSIKLLENQGKEFVIDESNEPWIKFIALYLAEDERAAKWLRSNVHKVFNDFSFKKGLLICGSYGLGKTMIFKAVSMAQIPAKKFGVVTTNSAVQQYESEGPKFLNQFFKGNRCFDDFGTESKAWHYGKQVDIFKTILEERYNAFINEGLITHISTNLTIDEIGKRYGDRVESRLYEMFNIIVITGKDRRKNG